MTDQFLTLKEARTLLNISRATLWRWEVDLGLKVVRVGSVARVRGSDLQAFLKRHETSEGSPQAGG